MSRCDDWAEGWEEGRQQGEADMLAKCIHKVSLYLHEEVCSDTCRGYCAALDDVIAALKDLQEQP